MFKVELMNDKLSFESLEAIVNYFGEEPDFNNYMRITKIDSDFGIGLYSLNDYLEFADDVENDYFNFLN